MNEKCQIFIRIQSRSTVGIRDHAILRQITIKVFWLRTKIHKTKQTNCASSSTTSFTQIAALITKDKIKTEMRILIMLIERIRPLLIKMKSCDRIRRFNYKVAVF